MVFGCDFYQKRKGRVSEFPTAAGCHSLGEQALGPRMLAQQRDSGEDKEPRASDLDWSATCQYQNSEHTQQKHRPCCLPISCLEESF